MKDFFALRSLLVVMGLLVVVLLLIGLAVIQDQAAWIVPSPEKAAEQLVSALGAHRYEGAMNQLSQGLRQQVDETDLSTLVQAIENSRQGIQDAHEVNSEIQDRSATASVRVKLGNNQEQTLDFPLQKENGLWKVTSIDPLQILANSP